LDHDDDQEDEIYALLFALALQTLSGSEEVPSRLHEVIEQLEIAGQEEDLQSMSLRPLSEHSRPSQDSVCSLLQVQWCPDDPEALEEFDSKPDQCSFRSLRILEIISGERFLLGYEDWDD
jgi:hypothetical protein